MTQTHEFLEKHGPSFRILDTYGEGVEFVYTHTWGKGTKTVPLRSSIRREPGKPRRATLKLTSWAGVSLGAVHYYARIETEYHDYTRTDTSEPYHSNPSDYETGVPFGGARLCVEMTRLVDSRDLKHDKDMEEMNGGESMLYGRMKRGDHTHGFWSESEAKAAAIKFFQEHFGDGWILVPECYDEDEPPVLASTVKEAGR